MDTPSPASMLMYNNFASLVLLVCDPSHNVTSPSQTTPHPWMTMEFHFYRLHRETSVILQVWHYLGHSQLAHQAGDLYPCPWHHHIRGLSTSVCSSCVPSHVTFDRGSEFVSNFFQSLDTALDMRLHFTSGYHPEGDGQTKCTNQTLEQYLCVYCNYQ